MAKFKLATADVEALFALIYELKDMRVERRNEAAARRMVHEAQRKKSMKREQPDRSGEQSSNGLSAYPSGRRDLGVQVAALCKALHIWITTGEPPPPTPPTLIQLILIAAGADALEKAFLAAFCYHFGADYAERYGVLVDRRRLCRRLPRPSRTRRERLPRFDRQGSRTSGIRDRALWRAGCLTRVPSKLAALRITCDAQPPG